MLDRDGTILVERDYLTDPEAVELVEGAVDGLKRLADLGFGLVVITNQSGVGRGLMTERVLHEIHRRMATILAGEGVVLDGLYYCPHVPEDDCDCRKPRTGMVERAAATLKFDPARCVVVGDKAADIELGRAIGATTVLVRTGHGAELEATGFDAADHVVNDLREAAEVMERLVARASGNG